MPQNAHVLACTLRFFGFLRLVFAALATFLEAPLAPLVQIQDTHTTTLSDVMWQFIQVVWLTLLISTYSSSGITQTSTQQTSLVQPNDTLWSLATRLRPPGVSTAQMIIALQRANPAAFNQGNLNQLRAGITLQIPSLVVIHQLSPAEATALFRQQLAQPAVPPPTRTPNIPLSAEIASEIVPIAPSTAAVAPADVSSKSGIASPQMTTSTLPFLLLAKYYWLGGMILLLGGIIVLIRWQYRRRLSTDRFMLPATSNQPSQQANQQLVNSKPNGIHTPVLSDKLKPTAQSVVNNAANLPVAASLDRPLPNLDAAFAALTVEEPVPMLQVRDKQASSKRDALDDNMALAHAYRELGDMQSARELLEEVQQEGDLYQQRQANEQIACLS